MRVFIVMCLIAATCAGKLGYNYQPGGDLGSGAFLSPGSGNIGYGVNGIIGGGNQGSLGHAGNGIGGNGGVNLGLAVSDVGNIGGGGIGSFGIGNLGVNNLGAGGFGQHVPSSLTAPVELQKEFYTFSAPESEFEDMSTLQRLAGSVRKGLRVIFIKGPENNALEKAAVSLAKQAVEQKTAIYVLNKQVDVGDLTNKLNVINTNINNKPEVHFVKYRTHEDAINAQKTIENQYESLGGTSQSHNEGVAPALNFASQAPVHIAPAHSPDNAYLPSSVLRN